MTFAPGFLVDFFGVLLTMDFLVIAIAGSPQNLDLNFSCLVIEHSVCQTNNQKLLFQPAQNVVLTEGARCLVALEQRAAVKNSSLTGEFLTVRI